MVVPSEAWIRAVLRVLDHNTSARSARTHSVWPELVHSSEAALWLLNVTANYGAVRGFRGVRQR
eukprot:60751-Pelagomonas_calceolata.AAC.2